MGWVASYSIRVPVSPLCIAELQALHSLKAPAYYGRAIDDIVLIAARDYEAY